MEAMALLKIFIPSTNSYVSATLKDKDEKLCECENMFLPETAVTSLTWPEFKIIASYKENTLDEM